jgi:GNAT superfamily N-acetyltransferase
MTVFVDHALARRIEASEGALVEGQARAAAEHLRGCGAVVASIAGGRAAFVAPGLSVSRAAGLGMSDPVHAADIDELETFYHSRGSDGRILVSPFADASLFELLGERGFRLCGLDTILVRPIDESEPIPGPPPAIVVRRAALEDAAAWVHTSLAGFAPPGGAPHFDRAPFFEAAFHSASAVYFMATVAGVVAGGAALDIHAGAAYFFAASTLPAFRGCGVQGALIAARLSHARDAGCDLACTGTAPGSASQRNFERAGFAPAYSQALLIKPFG